MIGYDVVKYLSEHPKSRFQNEDSETMYVLDKCIVIKNTTKMALHVTIEHLLKDWDKIKIPATLQEAIAAINSNTMVRCEYTDSYNKTHVFIYDGKDKDITMHLSFLTEGKWYIE